MFRIRRLIPAVLVVGGLAACAGGASVLPGYTGNYNPSLLRYAAGTGDMYTEIIGNPFGAPEEKLASAVTGTMFGAHFGPDIRFNTKRDPGNTSPYRVVVLFNPGRNVTPPMLCENSQQPSRTDAATLRVMLAFCSGGYRETSVTGRMDPVSSPDDARFRALIRQMTGQLFPPRNPDPNGGPGADFNS